LEVTDTVTGATKTYDNPAGQLASRGDTAALPGAGAAGTGAASADAFEVRAPAIASGTCPLPVLAPAGPGLCLNGLQFEVEVEWHDPFNGTSGVGQGVGLTDDSGYFW